MYINTYITGCWNGVLSAQFQININSEMKPIVPGTCIFQKWGVKLLYTQDLQWCLQSKYKNFGAKEAIGDSIWRSLLQVECFSPNTSPWKKEHRCFLPSHFKPGGGQAARTASQVRLGVWKINVWLTLEIKGKGTEIIGLRLWRESRRHWYFD